MALNSENLGQEIQTEFANMETADKYIPLKNMQAQSKAIVNHFKLNAEILSEIQESTITGSQEISSDSLTVVQFTGDNFTSGIATGLDSGQYLLAARITFSDLTAACSEIYAVLSKNNNQIDFSRSPSIDYATMTLSKIISLNSEDSISVSVYQNHGITGHNLDSSPIKTYFTLTRIGSALS